MATNKSIKIFEQKANELMDESTKRIEESRNSPIFDKYVQKNNNPTEVKGSDEFLECKDGFPEDNRSQKKKANILMNPKNSTLPSTKDQSSEIIFLKKKKQRAGEEKNQPNTKISEKSEKNFSIAKKGDNIAKDKSIQRKEIDYYQIEEEVNKFPEITEPTTNELTIFFNYQTDLLNKIIKEYRVLTRLSSQNIKTLFSLMPFKLFKKRSLFYIFSYMSPENMITIKNGIEIEESNGKSSFKYLMNLTFEEVYANCLSDCNVYVNGSKIYIFLP